MRQPRLKILHQHAAYHVICRITQGQLWLGEVEKEFLMGLLHRVAFYCGIEVITFCIMSNHFHLLVRVPEKSGADSALNFTQFIGRVRVLYGDKVATELQGGPDEAVPEEMKEEWEGEVALHKARMHDLSVFMKLLKQRFTMWHNFRLKTKGTLWTERFKSVLVESRGGAGNPVDLVAAYIDLNPVRAGIVTQAKDYPHSGYGSSRMGNVNSQQGVGALVQEDSGGLGEDTYQQLMEQPTDEAGSAALSLGAVLRRRQAAMVKGMILGSAEFVMAVVEAMIEIRRSLRPQAYAAGGMGGSLWTWKRFRRDDLD